MSASGSRADIRHGREVRVGDLVLVARGPGFVGGQGDYRRDFRRCSGKVLPVVGWDSTGLAWLPLRGCAVLSVAPHLLIVVRRNVLPKRVKLPSNSAPHRDGREASRLAQPSSTPARGRER